MRGFHTNKNCKCAICYRKPLSEESRKKLSDSLKKNHPFKGKHLSDEWKKNISDVLKGKPKSKEHNLKVSEAHKKRFRENPEARLRYIGDRNPAKLPENRKGIFHSEQTKQLLRQITLKQFKNGMPIETRNKIGKSHKGRKQTAEWIIKRSESLKKKYREDKEYRERQITISCKNFQRINKPTSIEIKTKKILDKYYPNQWIYTGTGVKTIGNLNPDFIHSEKKVVIEVNGLYWHNLDETKEKINRFKDAGYECIVIWEDELKDKMYETTIVEKVSKHV